MPLRAKARLSSVVATDMRPGYPTAGARSRSCPDARAGGIRWLLGQRSEEGLDHGEHLPRTLLVHVVVEVERGEPAVRQAVGEVAQPVLRQIAPLAAQDQRLRLDGVR